MKFIFSVILFSLSVIADAQPPASKTTKFGDTLFPTNFPITAGVDAYNPDMSVGTVVGFLAFRPWGIRDLQNAMITTVLTVQ